MRQQRPQVTICSCTGTLLAWTLTAGFDGKGEEAEEAMKIFMLLILIGVIVGLSYLPIRGQAKQAAAVPPDSVPA
jgi:hypothetical protein